jgi:pyruvate dehydrogenase (quinone)
MRSLTAKLILDAAGIAFTQAVARTVSDLAKRDAVLVIDTGLNTLWSANWIRQSGSQRIIGSFNNGAVGTALGQAVHHRLPVKVVVYNNGAFGLIVLEAEALGVAASRKGIEFPNPDYVTLARACGAHGFRAAQPGELRATIEQAFEVDGPAIIDCAVVPDEMPNFPHIEVDQAGRYAVAKIKEAWIQSSDADPPVTVRQFGEAPRMAEACALMT